MNFDYLILNLYFYVLVIFVELEKAIFTELKNFS